MFTAAPNRSIQKPTVVGSASGVSPSATFTAAVPRGSVVLVFLEVNGAGTTVSGVTDTKSNTYTLIDSNTTTCSYAVYYSITSAALTTSDSVTATTSATMGMKVAAVAGVRRTSPLDLSGQKFSGTGSTSLSKALPALGYQHEILFAWFSNTVGSGTVVQGASFVALSTTAAGALGYRIARSPAAITYTASWTGSASYAGCVVSLKG